jgi:hypothetical protein
MVFYTHIHLQYILQCFKVITIQVITIQEVTLIMQDITPNFTPHSKTQVHTKIIYIIRENLSIKNHSSRESNMSTSCLKDTTHKIIEDLNIVALYTLSRLSLTLIHTRGAITVYLLLSPTHQFSIVSPAHQFHITPLAHQFRLILNLFIQGFFRTNSCDTTRL